MNVIADTDFVVAMANIDDRYRIDCLRVYRQFSRILVPQSVITETALLLNNRKGSIEIARFLLELDVKSKFQVEALEQQDIERTARLLQKYHDTRLDFVDASVIAMAERFNIRTVLTLDHRDFRLVKPRHCDYLTLLPELSPGS